MKLFCCLLFLLTARLIQAQEIKMFAVSGLVTDEGGRPLKDVQVWITGAETSKTTGTDGRYQVQLPYSKTAMLRFSHKAYQDKRVNINSSTVVNVTLSRRYEQDSFRYVISNAGMPVTFFTQPEPKRNKDRDIIYTRVEIEASFMGSLKGIINRYIENNSGLMNNRGEVMLNYIIDKKGNIEEIELVKGTGTVADSIIKQALLSTRGRWRPAIDNGIPAASYRSLLVKFDSPEDEYVNMPDKVRLPEKPGGNLPPWKKWPDTTVIPAGESSQLALQLLNKVNISEVIKDLIMNFPQQAGMDSAAREQVMKLVLVNFGNNMPGYYYVRNLVAAKLINRFSLTELKELAAFYNTPLGTKSGAINSLVYDVFLQFGTLFASNNKREGF